MTSIALSKNPTSKAAGLLFLGFNQVCLFVCVRVCEASLIVLI